MRARDEILRDFKVDKNGVIHTPGKFEGEMIYSPYFYGVILGSGGDEYDIGDGSIYSVFEIGQDDIKEFPELSDVVGVICHETEQGFFETESYLDKKKFNEAWAELIDLAAYDDREEEGERDEERGDLPWDYTKG